MLPKVATHLFHTTSRAAAQVVQRNVLQQTGHSTGSNLGTRNGPSSSNWGGHGPGTGGAKHNTGSSRFYSFSSAGRAVSQANAVSANIDGSFASDENDEPIPRRVVVIQSQSQSKRTRIRSSSATLTKAESLGVLKTLQLHSRSRFLHTSIEAAAQSHPAALNPSPSRPRRNSTASSDDLNRPSSPVRNFSTAAGVALEEQNDQPLPRPRRNSTSSIDDLNKSSLDTLQSIVEDLPSQSSSSALSSDNLERGDDVSIKTKSTPPSEVPLSNSLSPDSPASTYAYEYLIEAKQSGDFAIAAEAVARFRSIAQSPDTQDFNNAIDAIYATRSGEKLDIVINLYNDMINRSVQPDDRTYSTLLLCALDRDFELGHTIRGISELLRRQAVMGGGLDVKATMGGQYRLEARAEEHRNNYATTLSLFYAARVNAFVLAPRVYLELIRTCARHSNLELSEEIFHFVLNRWKKLQPYYYRYMIQAYGKAGDIVKAERVFDRYKINGQKGNLAIDQQTLALQKAHILVWNAMIEAYFCCGLPDKAVGVLDQMMNSRAELGFGIKDVPLPASSTYTEILKGFIEAGDIVTAWNWFERLLEQGVEREGSFWPSKQPIRPDGVATNTMLTVLAERGHITELNKLFLAVDRTILDSQTGPMLVYKANMAAIEGQVAVPNKLAKEILSFLATEVFPRTSKLVVKRTMVIRIVLEYVTRGMYQEALASYEYFHGFLLQEIKDNEQSIHSSLDLMMAMQEAFGRIQDSMLETLLARKTLDFSLVSSLMKRGRDLAVEMPRRMQKGVLHAYARAKGNDALLEKMTTEDWEQLLMLAVNVESIAYVSPALATRDFIPVRGYAFEGVLSLLEDMAKHQVKVEDITSSVMNKTIRHFISVYEADEAVRIFKNLGPAFERALEESDEIRTMAAERKSENAPENVLNNEYTPRLTLSYGDLVIDPAHSKAIDDLLRQNTLRAPVLAAYGLIKNGFDDHRVPSPRAIGRLIQSLGRQGEAEKAREIYAFGQMIVKRLLSDPEIAKSNWVVIEDHMIIALVHLGELDAAHTIRLKLLEEGAAPSADAYGTLILNVKDTTDDASNALALYQEARMHNIKPNIYFYNNIISKLAKARKADHALELFHKMKADKVQPSSITYGALIGACSRVGDIESAENLFEEMESQWNFKPRVPPYNTMMQLYTSIKPNRERVLWYFDRMCQARVKPSAHTYKLLLDAYGSIEPVDILSMEAIFDRVKKDPSVDIQGAHYASIINAYGCIQRDLEKALSIFDSIPLPSTRTNYSVLDAVAFESIINVIISHRHMDLVPEYINKMVNAGIHMTAYIANFLIRGYANIGEMEKAREFFEGMVDPPTGVAAPNNHAPHNPTDGKPVGTGEPIYREPSTWEVMVRAELGAGHRDRAMALLERLKTRQYPEAVYNRISGVLVDHSSLVV